MSYIPYAVSWNITSKCNLHCAHCYISANELKSGTDEIDTNAAFGVVDQISAVNPAAVLIFTGGEPLLRDDIYSIIRHAANKGLTPVVGTNGILLEKEVCAELKRAGAVGIGVSIDSIREEMHDTFRGRPGSLAASMEGLRNAKEAGLEIQVQTTPTNDNINEIPLIAEMAWRLGCKVFGLFFLVCTGRAEKMTDISPENYEKALRWALESAGAYPGMMIRPKCAPHFKRILHQADANHPLLSSYIAACRAGTHYCRIGPEGEVTPCPYMDVSAGNLREKSFADIWNNSELFGKYRAPVLTGKCGLCQYRLLCGGCRARAWARTGDDMGEDAWCVYEPAGLETALENADTASKFENDSISAIDDGKIRWTAEAEQVMEKIPFFARKIVRLAVNRYALANGLETVTPEMIKKGAPPPGGIVRNRPEPAAETGSEKVQDIPWDADARARVENAPEFVRKGILKMMPIRARQRGKTRIDSDFLTEIRDESMALVTGRMKKMGFEQLDISAFAAAREKFSGDPKKRETIDKIVTLLAGREKKNEGILKKFSTFFAGGDTDMLWTEDASARIGKAPLPMRSIVKRAVEKFARERKCKYVSAAIIEEYMATLPAGVTGFFRK